jgi:hypothetical protein
MLRSGTLRSRLQAIAITSAVVAGILAIPTTALAEFPPVISNTNVTPTSLTYTGGNVTVSANVNDDIGQVEVYVDVTFPGGSYGSQAMIGNGPTPDAFTAVVELPANPTTEPIEWTFTVRARDLEQQESSAIAGYATVDGQPPFDESPLLSDPSVTPTNLPSAGGRVDLAVTASDQGGISEAYAVIARQGKPSVDVALEPIGADRFTGFFNAPVNKTGQPVPYTVTFYASDDIGQQTSLAGPGFTVAPVTGNLKVTPANLNFGGVKAGNAAQRSITVKNTGGSATAVIKGVVTSSGRPFVVVGNGAFTLRPGQSKTFKIEFRPTAVSTFTGKISVARSDGGQPALGTTVTGRGLRK